MEFNISTTLNDNTINDLSNGKIDLCILSDVDKDTIKQFGELLEQDLTGMKEITVGNDDIKFNLQKIEMGWHSDGSHLNITPKFGGLYGVEIGEGSSPTYFCNMKSVWKNLSVSLKEKIKNESKVTFSVQNYYDKAVWPFLNFDSEKQEQTYLRFAKAKKSLYHNDEFGEYLFYSPFYSPVEYLDNNIFQEKYIHTHHWKNRDLVVWNNYTTSHKRDDTSPDITRRLVRYAIDTQKHDT